MQKSTEPIRLKPILLPSPPRFPTHHNSSSTTTSTTTTIPNTHLMKSSSPRYSPYTKPSTSSPISLPSINTVLPPSSPYSTPISPMSGYCTFSPESGTVTPLSQPLFIQTDDSYWYGMSAPTYGYDVYKFGSPPVITIPYPYSQLPNGQVFSSSCY